MENDIIAVECLRVASNIIRPIVETEEAYMFRIAKHAADLHLKYNQYLQQNAKILNK